MALTVSLRAEDYPTTSDIVFKATRIDHRVTVSALLYERPGQEKPKARPTRSKRSILFIITGKATQTEKDALESASATWWTKGSGATKGRVRFYWGDNNGGNPYECAITKADFSNEGKMLKYDYMVELAEGAF